MSDHPPEVDSRTPWPQSPSPVAENPVHHPKILPAHPKFQVITMPPAKPKAPEELSKDERLDLAIEEYRKAFVAYNISEDPNEQKPSIRLIAREYGLVHTTVLRRVTGKTLVSSGSS